MSANQSSVVSSLSLESKMDVEMRSSDGSGKNEVQEMETSKRSGPAEVGGLDDDVDTDLVTLYLIDRKEMPVFRKNKMGEDEKVEFKLTKKELSLSRLFFELDKDGNAVTSLQSLDEAIPISMSWATGSNPDVPNPYTTDDAAYALGKCVEWMKHFNGYSIGIIGQIPGTKFMTSLRSKNLEEECRGLDPRTHDQLAQNKMRKLVREKLMSEIKKLKGMSEDAVFDKKTENKMIYDMRDKVERESTYIKWLDETLERTKQEEEKFFKENPPWFLTWAEEIEKNRTFRKLCAIMSCASYFDIKPLTYLSGAVIATIIRRKTAAQVKAEIQMRENRELNNQTGQDQVTPGTGSEEKKDGKREVDV